MRERRRRDPRPDPRRDPLPDPLPGPRIGLGAGRVEPEQARFRTVGDLVRYLCDLQLLTHAELAERCGVRREQVSRWLTGRHQPNLATLAGAVDRLGWTLVLGVQRRDADLDALVTDPPELDDLLGSAVRAVLRAVAEAGREGLDVVVGGEVAAVLQGVPVPTTHLVLHTRPDHHDHLLEVARRHWLRVGRQGGATTLFASSVAVPVRYADRRPATRVVRWREHDIPVVHLDELLADPDGAGPSVSVLAGRFASRADRQPD